MLNTAHTSTYVCRNCDLYPYIMMPLPDERIVEIQAEAGRKVREFKERGRE